MTTVDVTPSDLTSVTTAGYADQAGNPHAVDYPLEANVLGLSGGSLAAPIYVVTIDALYGGSLRTEIASRLACTPENVVVLGSHTHFAPASDAGLPRLGRTHADYTQATAERIADAILKAPWHQHARVRMGTSEVSPDMFMNRRRRVLGLGVRVPKIGAVLVAPNPAGPVDRTVRLFEVLDADGQILALAWGASCHPVCSPDRHAISSDFPGVVREALRQEAAGLPVLFFQGCSGDVRPASTTRRPPRSLVGFMLYLFAFGRIFGPQSRADFERWCSAVAATAEQAKRACGEEGGLRPGLRRVTGHTRGDWARTPEFAVVDVTSDLSLLAVNAEVVSGRIGDLAGSGPSSMVIPATCADEVIGYWPTTAMVKEGGYEGCLSRINFPQVDWANDDPDALWNSMVKEALTNPTVAW